MVPYIILILLPMLFCFIAIGKGERKSIVIGKSEYIKKNNLALPVFFIIYFLMLALRDINVGNDTANYEFYFSYYDSPSYKIIFYISLDYLYGLFNWLFHKVSHDFQLFLTVVAAFSVFPIAKLYCENRKNSMFQIAIFVNLSTFVMLFSGLRQAMAMAVGIVAYKFVKEKKPFWFILTCLVAFGFHHSAFILFFMYPLYHISLHKKHIIVILPAIALFFLFNKQIFVFLTNVAAFFSDKYEDIEITQTGAITVFLMFVVFTILCYLIPDESKMDEEMFGLRNMLLFSMFLQSFASIHTLAMRMNYYYMIFIPIIMAKLMEIPKDKYKQVAKVGKTAITVFLLLYFFYTLYRDYTTGSSALNTVPYVAFWENSL